MALAAFAIATFGVSACGKSDSEGRSVNKGKPINVGKRPVRPTITANPVVTFAPLVHLHSTEAWLPVSADFVLRHSTLEWKDGCPERNLAAGAVARQATGEDAPRLVVERLGGDTPYRQRPRRAGCSSLRRAAYSTTQRTRPGDREGRPAGLGADEGFALDFLAAAYGVREPVRRGRQAYIRNVPVYYKRRPATINGRTGMRISYWMLYGYTGLVEDRKTHVFSHEGDWERVDVLLRRGRSPSSYTPTAVRIYRDRRPETVPWRKLDLAAAAAGDAEATHPVVYSASRSHTPYTRPGRHRRRVTSYTDKPTTVVEKAAACVRCPRWPAWDELRNVEDEPWYGYGGGWGAGILDGPASGPLGPSPYN